ncbi:MAG: tRNA lysidine(34) synthetase TilS, partial [Candidatus Aminicenantes bacterium]|nr:tRNA lysidine(34) synthetase TilS [Candidatus Aminicenantes bacterium]
FARKHKLNLEEAGRILRYDFLKKTAGKLGNAKIATGHTMTDQAETFLMRMLRGSGLKGLAGIPPMRDGNIIRPLLSIEREEIRTFLGERGAAYCCDESNKDLSFFRNRIRAELLPYLRENFDPKIVRRISKMTSLVREDECLLEQLTKDTARGVFIQKKEGLCLDMGSLSFLPLALQRRLARNFLFRIKDNLKGISFGDVDRILELKEGGELYLPGGLVLKRERGMLVDRSTLSTECIYRYSWSGQEKLEIRELCMSVSGKIHIESGADSLFSDDRMSACLDRDRLRFPLTVRNRAAGDRYQPFGAPGSKKLKEIMRAKGIPPSERDAHPVFLSGEDIVWVQGLPVSESFKVSDSTHEVFMISIKS